MSGFLVGVIVTLAVLYALDWAGYEEWPPALVFCCGAVNMAVLAVIQFLI